MTDVFMQGGDAVQELVRRGRATNRHRDVTDRNAGMAAPGDCGHCGLLRTAITAICTGLEILHEDGERAPSEAAVDCIAESVGMIQDVERSLRMEIPSA